MARRKVKLAYITNNSARRTTYKKRKKGMMKKLSELSTLCGIDACAIIYNPYDSQPEVWPSPSGVENDLEKFKNIPEMEKSRKMLNQEGFLREMISKANEQLKKVKKENCEKELRGIVFKSLTTGIPQLQDLNFMDMDDLGRLINQKLDEINSQKMALGEEATGNQNQTVQVAPTTPATATECPRRNTCQGIHEHKTTQNYRI